MGRKGQPIAGDQILRDGHVLQRLVEGRKTNA